MYDTYESPLETRYASREMQSLFSAQKKFSTWRRLWLALAEGEKELGLPITEEQLSEMRAHLDDINFEVAEAREKEVRHDVMAHVYAFGLQCPKAAPIIHLGATSCFVGDNADIIIMREALGLLRAKLVNVIGALSDFAEKYKDMPALGFTHLQPAQLTTVGKRAALWTQDFAEDYAEVEYRLSGMRLRGVKGTTGTQASFLELFGGDGEKVKRLDELVADKMGFKSSYPVTGQTYPRKLDYQIMSSLSGIAQSAHKFTNDVRLLQSMKEIEEPFEKHQIGSSAMAYKRNPMRCERIASLSRYLINLSQNAAMTSSEQWLERTLDDSANRRLTIAEGFLTADAVLELVLNVADGLVVYPKTIAAHIKKELPFMATENILMDAVLKGGNRQELHEKIRAHSMEAARLVKEEGAENDLLRRIAADPAFGLGDADLDRLLEPRLYVGRAPEQTAEYVETVRKDILEPNEDVLGRISDISV